MPPRQPKSHVIHFIGVDCFLVFALFALLGHVAINFWEHFTIEKELVNMKKSVHNLKHTINNIGKVYDNLHTNINDLYEIVDLQEPNPNEIGTYRCKNPPCNNEHHHLDKRMKYVFTAPAANITRGFENKQTDVRGRVDKKVGPNVKNAATITKNHLKPVDIQSNHHEHRYVYDQKNKIFHILNHGL